MTRINCVPPEELVGPHLLAEYRELPRIFTLVEERLRKGQTPQQIKSDVPESYRMGAGHVSFFFDKLGYLRSRHSALVTEMRRRGWEPQIDCSDRSVELPTELQQDWEPNELARLINRVRIRRRLRGKGQSDRTSGSQASGDRSSGGGTGADRSATG